MAAAVAAAWVAWAVWICKPVARFAVEIESGPSGPLFFCAPDLLCAGRRRYARHRTDAGLEFPTINNACRFIGYRGVGVELLTKR